MREDIQQVMNINPLVAEVFQQHGLDEHSNGLNAYVNALEDTVMRLHNVLFVQVAEMQTGATPIDSKDLIISLN